MKKMFIIIGLFLLGTSSVLANEIAQDYLDIALDYFSQGDYQNSSEYVSFTLQLEPENAQALELKNKIYTIANTPVGISKEPKVEIAPIVEVQQKPSVAQEVKPEAGSVVEAKPEVKVEPVAEPTPKPEIKAEPIVEPTLKPEVKVEPVTAKVKQEQVGVEPVEHVCPVDLSPTQTAEIVNSQVETPAEIEQFMILELPKANISDMEYPKYTKFQKNLLNFIDDLIIRHPNKKSLYYAKLKIYRYKNDDARYDELSEFIIKKFEQVK